MGARVVVAHGHLGQVGEHVEQGQRIAHVEAAHHEVAPGQHEVDFRYDDALVTEVLQKMIKQRRESIALYEQGGRAELAQAEQAEVAVIEDFLPQQMSEDETKAAIDAIVAEIGAASVKDMGRVMAALKERHASQLDMSKASGLVKARLG